MPYTSADPKGLLNSAQIILRETCRYLDPSILKVKRMQDLYLTRNSTLYSEAQKVQIERWLASVQYKYLAAHVHLEGLWALSMACRWSLLDVLENTLEKQVWHDDEIMIGSMYLENFLLQARSFLNIYLFYICLIMNIPEPESITINTFQKHMQNVKGQRFEGRAKALKQYVDEGVFAEGLWGKLLKDLRDKITHRESLLSSNQGNEVILSILLDWPTIRGMSFERFAQEFSNGIFEMLKATTPILFELEWKSGVYKEDLWD